VSEGRWLFVMGWVVIGLLVFGVGFGPAYVSHQADMAAFAVQCDIARAERENHRANRLALEANALIAAELGLPVAAQLDEFVRTYHIPEVPPECER
jgi:hypothetical protein